jgi:polysaccharide export outer membrane protein
MRLKMKKYFVLIAVIACFCFMPPAFSQESTTKTIETWSAKASQEEYRIGVGDTLEITTWKEPDLTRQNVLVRTDGKISFPLLNDVQASGLTPTELKINLEKRLQDFVSNPTVTVTVTDPGSQRFYILGEVARTGEYPLAKHLTVLQAFALAGGFTQWASKDEIILLRKIDGVEKIFKIDYKSIIKGRDIESNLALQANDTIIVP